jgi:hypothetical protein
MEWGTEGKGREKGQEEHDFPYCIAADDNNASCAAGVSSPKSSNYKVPIIIHGMKSTHITCSARGRRVLFALQVNASEWPSQFGSETLPPSLLHVA